LACETPEKVRTNHRATVVVALCLSECGGCVGAAVEQPHHHCQMHPNKCYRQKM